MLALLLTLVVLGAAKADPKRMLLSSPRLLQAEFSKFQALEHRHYQPSEQAYRLRVFRGNLEKIIECNERHSTYTCAENRFTDLTDSEKEAFTGLQNMTDTVNKKRHLKIVGKPESFDWRNHGAVTGVKNQEQCGSCWTFSAIAAIEGAYFLATDVLKSFSEQELLDCTYETKWPGYDGCRGGWYYDAFDYVMTANRLAREVNFPYEEKDTPCEMADVPNDLGVAQLTSYVTVNKGDDNLANAVAITPVSVAMLSHGDFYSYSTGIYDGHDCQCNWSPNHALAAVAYDADSFVIKNSWGKTWGDGGYIRIARGLKHSVCRVADFAHYPIFTAYGVEPTLPPTDEPSTDVGPTEDNGGCAKGTTRCPDGVCRHVHMC